MSGNNQIAAARPLLAASRLTILLTLSLPAVRASAGEPARERLFRCNDFDRASTAWACVAAGAGEPLKLRSLDPPVMLPDGTDFRIWEQPARHLRTFFVAQKHPEASDDNPGSAERPWKTIGRAAAALGPGDRVIVHAGVYREWVRPARGGTGPERMITYQAAAGEEVVISGAQPLAGPWRPSVRLDQGAPAGEPKMAGAWMADLPDALFDAHNPFAEANMSNTQAKQMPWATRWAGKHPYSAAQGLVFQGNRRLVQTQTRDQLARAPGTYWVEPGGRRLHVRLFDDKDPNKVELELTTRQFAIAPERTGLGFVRVAGFTVERVASCFPMPQRGAISIRQGHHWIIEDNLVRQVNSIGLDVARRPVARPMPEPPDTPELAGVANIVRRNGFIDCGICSMQGLGVIAGLVEDNYSHGCGWHRVQPYCETGGIKLHYNKHTLIRRNLVHGTIDAPGIWIDHSNANTRLTANVVVGARSTWGGIFFEASQKRNMVDHNVVWDCTGSGIYQHDCDRLIVTNNLLGQCPTWPVRMRFSKNRVVDANTGKRATARGNRVLGNVFYGFTRPPELPATDNLSDYNLFVNRPGEKPIDLAATRQAGRETHSRRFTARLDLDTSTWTLTQQPPLPSLSFPRVSVITHDYLLAPRLTPTTSAGPFVEENLKGRIVLRQKRG